MLAGKETRAGRVALSITLTGRDRRRIREKRVLSPLTHRRRFDRRMESWTWSRANQPIPVYIHGYTVNHRLTVRPQPLRLMAPGRRAVHRYYVAHPSVWLIIGSARVIQLLNLPTVSLRASFVRACTPVYIEYLYLMISTRGVGKPKRV